MANEEIEQIMAFETIWAAEMKKKKAMKAQIKAAKAQVVNSIATASATATAPSESTTTSVESTITLSASATAPSQYVELSLYELQKLEEEITPFSDVDKDTMQQLPHRECSYLNC